MSDDYYKNTMNIFAHTSVPWQQTILLNFLKSIILPDNPRILDIGSGIGNNIDTLLQFSKFITVTDVSEKALSLLKERYKGKIQIDAEVCDVEKLPFHDDTFDLVVCTEVFEHIKNLPQAIKEVLRVLKPKGYIIFSSPNYLNPAGITKVIFELTHQGKSWDAWGNHEDGHENLAISFKLCHMFERNRIYILKTCGGDVIRSWLPFLRRHYDYIDKHPMLLLGKLPILKYFLMNFFILGSKVSLRQ